MANAFLAINLNNVGMISCINLIDLNEERIYCGYRLGDAYDNYVHIDAEDVKAYNYNLEVFKDCDRDRFLNINYGYYANKPIDVFFEDYNLSEHLI